MARFKVKFDIPNLDPRTNKMASRQQPMTIIVEAFNIPEAQRLVKAQYPGANVYGCSPA